MKNFKSSALVVGLTAMAMVGGAGCMDSGAQAVASEPITTLDTASGAHVEFYEPFRGELVVVASGNVPEDLEGKTPVEIYEALAAAQAPAVLHETQDRIAAARALRPPRLAPVESRVLEEAGRSTIASLSGSEFTDRFCNPGVVDFDHCLTSRTGNYSIEISGVDWIHSHANVYRGQVLHRMQIKHPPFGSFDVINTDTPTGDSYVSTFSETDNGTYLIEILQAADDGWHLSIHGDK